MPAYKVQSLGIRSTSSIQASAISGSASFFALKLDPSTLRGCTLHPCAGPPAPSPAVQAPSPTGHGPPSRGPRSLLPGFPARALAPRAGVRGRTTCGQWGAARSCAPIHLSPRADLSVTASICTIEHQSRSCTCIYRSYPTQTNRQQPHSKVPRNYRSSNVYAAAGVLATRQSASIIHAHASEKDALEKGPCASMRAPGVSRRRAQRQAAAAWARAAQQARCSARPPQHGRRSRRARRSGAMRRASSTFRVKGQGFG